MAESLESKVIKLVCVETKGMPANEAAEAIETLAESLRIMAEGLRDEEGD